MRGQERQTYSSLYSIRDKLYLQNECKAKTNSSLATRNFASLGRRKARQMRDYKLYVRVN